MVNNLHVYHVRLRRIEDKTHGRFFDSHRLLARPQFLFRLHSSQGARHYSVGRQTIHSVLKTSIAFGQEALS
jgi:hypothetical protein